MCLGIGMFGSTFDKILRIIKEWHPSKDYRSEAGYRDDLLKHIRMELKKEKETILGPPERHRIRKESGRHLADIGIDDNIGIELKRNLSSQSELDRLVGQIRRFKGDYRHIIVVLCGRTNEERLDALQHEFKEYSGAWGGPETVIKIVPKKTMQKKKGPKGWIDLFEDIK